MDPFYLGISALLNSTRFCGLANQLLVGEEVIQSLEIFLSVGVIRLSRSETCDSHSHFCESQGTLNIHLLAECTLKGRLFRKPACWTADVVLCSGWETTG